MIFGYSTKFVDGNSPAAMTQYSDLREVVQIMNHTLSHLKICD